MKRSTYLIWFRRLVVLGAVVAGLTASAAGAVPMLDPQSTPVSPVAANTTPLGLRADGLRWQAIATTYEQSSRTPVGHTTPLGSRADGLRWQAIAKAYQDGGLPATSSSSGLDWGDFGIGAGAMLGLALLVTGLGIGTATMGHRVGKLGTS
jgi:hypothetical protein